MDWNLKDVLGWVEQLEKCPAGAVDDGYAKDLKAFLNDYKRADLWKANSELCKRAQKAVVDYEKKKRGT